MTGARRPTAGGHRQIVGIRTTLHHPTATVDEARGMEMCSREVTGRGAPRLTVKGREGG
jgi:hypothetical protein